MSAQSYEVSMVGKFNFGKRAVIETLLKNTDRLGVAADVKAADLLVAADAVAKAGGEKPSAWNVAVERGIPIIDEARLAKIEEEKGFIDPTPYQLVPAQSDDNTIENPAIKVEEEDGRLITATETVVLNEEDGREAREEDEASQTTEPEDEEAGNLMEVDSENMRQQEVAGQGDTTNSPDRNRGEPGVQGNGVQQSIEGRDTSPRPAPASRDDTPAVASVSGLLTSDRYAGRHIPDWALIDIPVAKTPEGIAKTGVIECIVPGGYILASETTHHGQRRGYLLSGTHHAAEKRRFTKEIREVLSNEDVEDYKGKGLSLGRDVVIDMVAQCPAKTNVIAFRKDEKVPLLFTATMIKDIWGTPGRKMMERVMERAGQGSFKSRSEMRPAAVVDLDAQDGYLRERSRAMSEARTVTRPRTQGLPTPTESREGSRARTPAETRADNIKRVVDIFISRLTPEEIGQLAATE